MGIFFSLRKIFEAKYGDDVEQMCAGKKVWLKRLYELGSEHDLPRQERNTAS